MTLAFRVDASLRIGTGHVARCLTLAETLRQAGVAVAFVTRLLPGHMADAIAARGFAVHRLPAPEGASAPPPDPQAPAHADWAGVDWRQDAAETRALLLADPPDWLVMDHYAFDARWQEAALPPGARLLVIDDLADRPHRCDLLLDQNLGREAADYDALVPAACRRLIGPRHALLRPEFAAARAEALAARRARGGALRRVLVTMGGVDEPDATGTVLRALAAWHGAAGIEVDVVLGRNAPALDTVRALCPTLPFACTLAVDVDDMAQRMARADLAIGAVGGTAWERCTVGLPTLMVVLADNQEPAARALSATGAGVLLARPGDPGFTGALHAAMDRLSAPETLGALAAVAASVCDGQGAQRVAGAVLAPSLSLRPAVASDAEPVWHWRRAMARTEFLRSGSTPALEDHLRWFHAALADPGRRLYILQGPQPLGHLRLDLDDGAPDATVSIVLAPQARGLGLAVPALGLLCHEAQRIGRATLHAEVHADNAASMRAFAAAGFEAVTRDGPFVRFARSAEDRTRNKEPM